jgi:uncharacterized membrane protein YhaH (DUF805 family)
MMIDTNNSEAIEANHCPLCCIEEDLIMAEAREIDYEKDWLFWDDIDPPDIPVAVLVGSPAMEPLDQVLHDEEAPLDPSTTSDTIQPSHYPRCRRVMDFDSLYASALEVLAVWVFGLACWSYRIALEAGHLRDAGWYWLLATVGLIVVTVRQKILESKPYHSQPRRFVLCIRICLVWTVACCITSLDPCHRFCNEESHG